MLRSRRPLSFERRTAPSLAALPCAVRGHPQRLGQRRVPGLRRPRRPSFPRRPRAAACAASDASISPRSATPGLLELARGRRLVLTEEPARPRPASARARSSTPAAGATARPGRPAPSDTQAAATRMRSATSGSTARRRRHRLRRALVGIVERSRAAGAARTASTCRCASTLRSHVPSRLRPW